MEPVRRPRRKKVKSPYSPSEWAHKLAASPTTPLEQLEFLAGTRWLEGESQDKELHRLLAQNPSTPLAALERLAAFTPMTVLENPSLGLKFEWYQPNVERVVERALATLHEEESSVTWDTIHSKPKLSAQVLRFVLHQIPGSSDWRLDGQTPEGLYSTLHHWLTRSTTTLQLHATMVFFDLFLAKARAVAEGGGYDPPPHRTLWWIRSYSAFWSDEVAQPPQRRRNPSGRATLRMPRLQARRGW